MGLRVLGLKDIHYPNEGETKIKKRCPLRSPLKGPFEFLLPMMMQQRAVT